MRRALARDEQERRQRPRGRLNKQIVADLPIDECSVKRRRASLMAKLQVQSVAELAHLAQELEMRQPVALIRSHGAGADFRTPP